MLHSVVNFFEMFVSLYCYFQPFSNWMDGAKEDLVDMFIVHTVEEIQVFCWHVIDISVTFAKSNSHNVNKMSNVVVGCTTYKCTFSM